MWYLDTLFLREDIGGLEVVRYTQRYLNPGNWKIPADNSAGDQYHTPYAHWSAFKLRVRGRGGGQGDDGNTLTTTGPFEVALGRHGLGGLRTGSAPHDSDLARAKQLGPEVVDWVHERHRRLQERLHDVPAKPYRFSHANAFPNFSFNGASSAFGARGFYIWHPRGPREAEVWHGIAVERNAPQIVKELAVRSSGSQSATGFFGQDDNENFERVTENTATLMARTHPFHYAMAIHNDGEWPGHEEWDVEGLPGVVGPGFSEHNQRRFYAYWARLMAESASGTIAR